MKIAVVSDTHNNEGNTLLALKMIRSEGIDTIIHCGDMTNAHTAELFSDFVVHHVQGNNDFDMFSIGLAVQCCRPGSTSEKYYTGEIGGKRVAALHGHNHLLFDRLLESGKFDYIFHGHTHRRGHDIYEDEKGSDGSVTDEASQGTRSTHVINPGSLGGAYRGCSRGFCVVDLEADEVAFYEL